jgi:protein SCO1/2
MKIIFLIPLFILSQNVSAQSVSARSGQKYTGIQAETNSAQLPEELKGVSISEKIGDKIDLSLPVQNEKGETVLLSSFFQKHKPVMLSPIYYQCPGLCSFHFNGVIDALKKIDWNPGEKFEIVAFSFDASENTPAKAGLAQKKKDSYMKVYGRPGTENGFHFVTADQNTINTLMKQVGFQFRWNDKANEWSHASAAIMISPDGVISRYLHGVDFNPRDMKLGLNETANGKVGNIVDAAMLYCFKYDQHQSKYGLQVFRLVQFGGVLVVLLLGIWILPVLFRSKREKV